MAFLVSQFIVDTKSKMKFKNRSHIHPSRQEATTDEITTSFLIVDDGFITFCQELKYVGNIFTTYLDDSYDIK